MSHTATWCEGPDSCPDATAHPALTESWAIPRCAENRAENFNAPYCVSAYCPRCQLLRIAAGVDPVLANAWLYGPQGADYHAGLTQRGQTHAPR